MITLSLTTIGTSTGTILPKEMLARLKVQSGDTLYAIETAQGYLIRPSRSNSMLAASSSRNTGTPSKRSRNDPGGGGTH